MYRTFALFICPVFCARRRSARTSRKENSTKASIKDGMVTVVEDPKVTDEQLINAIHKLNYTAEVVQ